MNEIWINYYNIISYNDLQQLGFGKSLTQPPKHTIGALIAFKLLYNIKIAHKHGPSSLSICFKKAAKRIKF